MGPFSERLKELQSGSEIDAFCEWCLAELTDWISKNLTKDIDIAGELAQHSIIRWLETYLARALVGEEFTWTLLTRIATNAWNDSKRQQQRVQLFGDSDSVDLLGHRTGLHESVAGPEDDLLLKLALHDCLSRLTCDDQTIVKCYMIGYTCTATASFMNLSRPTLDRRLQAALRKLRSCLTYRHGWSKD